MKMTTCSVCDKVFPSLYHSVYKNTYLGKISQQCSYTCFRKEQAKIKRMKEANKNGKKKNLGQL